MINDNKPPAPEYKLSDYLKLGGKQTNKQKKTQNNKKKVWERGNTTFTHTLS